MTWEYVYVDNFTVINKTVDRDGLFTATDEDGNAVYQAESLEELVQMIVDKE